MLKKKSQTSLVNHTVSAYYKNIQKKIIITEYKDFRNKIKEVGMFKVPELLRAGKPCRN